MAGCGIVLVDVEGNVDIVEIKKPFDQCIMGVNKYRDNYVPLRELVGTVMQVEKYVYYLQRMGQNADKKLTEKYRDQLGRRLDIKVTNPTGLIIMGRSKGLSSRQIDDFEIVKRKYKNIMDILTYDDLIRRVETLKEQYADIISGAS